MKRDLDNKVLGGVIAGIAKEAGTTGQTMLYRGVFSIATLFLPFLAIAYGIAWVMIPPGNAGNASKTKNKVNSGSNSLDSTSLDAELRKIKRMLDSEIITQTEYDSMREKVLGAHMDIAEDELMEGSKESELKRLNNLHQSGIISKEELATLRRKALDI